MLPLWLHRAEEERRLRTSDAEFDRVVSMGVGPLDTGSEAQEALRSAAEWRRWEAIGADEPWLEHKRHQWAEELFAAQHKRRFLREQLRCVGLQLVVPVCDAATMQQPHARLHAQNAEKS